MEEEPIDGSLEGTSVSFHTPGSLISAFNSSLKVPLEQGTINLRGKYVQQPSRDYAGFFYDRMVDETSDDFVTLRVPRTVRSSMIRDTICTVNGFLERRVKGNKGAIECHFRVIRLLVQEEARTDPDIEIRQRVLETFMQRSWPNPEQQLKGLLAAGERPRLALLYGEVGIVHQDVMSSLGTANMFYDINEHREIFSDPMRVSERLKVLDSQGYDQLVVVRGGGSGLEVFDDIGLATTAACLTTPLLVALGHEVDHPFIERVSCRSFPTPTAFGEWLKKMADDVHEDLAHSKAALIIDIGKQFNERIKDLEEQVIEKNKLIEEQLGTISGLQKQMDDILKGFENTRAESDKRSSEVMDELRRQLSETRVESDGRTKDILVLRDGSRRWYMSSKGTERIKRDSTPRPWTGRGHS